MLPEIFKKFGFFVCRFCKARLGVCEKFTDILGVRVTKFEPQYKVPLIPS